MFITAGLTLTTPKSLTQPHLKKQIEEKKTEHLFNGMKVQKNLTLFWSACF